MKKNIIIIGLSILVVIFGVYIIVDYKSDKDVDDSSCNCESTKKEISTDSLDNSSYLGIYNYIEDKTTTTLVLNSDYSCIFYIGNDNNKAYYYGKYKIEDKKIVLYSVILQDTSSDSELYVDEEIYFNIVDSDVITSIYGRDKSIRLEKIYNIM